MGGFSKGLFGQGLFMIRAKGLGDLFLNSFGAIESRDLAEGEELIVDNFHLVGFSFSWVKGWQLCYAPCGPAPSTVPWMQMMCPDHLHAALSA